MKHTRHHAKQILTLLTFISRTTRHALFWSEVNLQSDTQRHKT